MENHSIAFTSKIRFVDLPAFKMFKKGDYIDYIHNKPNILKSKEFYSEGIRTCSGGGLVKPGIEAEGFHLWDDKTNYKKLPDIICSLFRFVKNPERGLLLGSKELEGSTYSLPQFRQLKNAFLNRVKNVSLFQQHKYENSQTHYHYSLEDDTWTLCTTYRLNDNARLQTVRSLKRLLKCFDKISIAKGDRLFIGKKEILPSDCPEIFA